MGVVTKKAKTERGDFFTFLLQQNMEFELCFHSMSSLQTDLISISYKHSLQWWFLCMQLQACVGSVCVGDTALMCHGRDVHGWVRQLDTSPSTRHWTVEVYVPQDPPQETPVVFGYIEVS